MVLRMLLQLMVSLSTFNIRGLGDEIKQKQLDSDCDRYKMDIICLQETKVTEPYERIYRKSGNKLIILQQFSGRHRGIGFLISKRMIPCVIEVKQISTNVAYLDIVLQSKSGVPTKCRIVNAYAPHSRAAEVSPKLREDFYEELTCAIENVPKHFEIFICGDFNARIGKLSDADLDDDVSQFVGSFGIGKRNDSGSHLLSFVINNDLFVCNTAFKHKSRHITTRTGYIRDPSDHSKTKPIYSQIDYVLCRRRFKGTLVDSRAFGGTHTDSDHKLVCAKFQFQVGSVVQW